MCSPFPSPLLQEALDRGANEFLARQAGAAAADIAAAVRDCITKVMDIRARRWGDEAAALAFQLRLGWQEAMVADFAHQQANEQARR